MGNYQGYQKYKDSGVVWLGDIPEHWEQKRFKFSVNLINNKIEAENSNLSYMGLEHIESWTGKKIEDKNASSEGIGSHFLPNDVLFGKLRPYLAKVYLSDIEGLASTEALVLRCKNNIFPKFLKYYILSRDFINIVDSSTFGAKMPRASWDFIGNLFFIFPPLNEQEKIAQFLDYKTKQIDELIKKKETLIEKLDEKRTAIISHAVTKGLDSSVPIKDSGVEWLGDIPEHWEVIKVKHLTKILRGKFTHRPRNDPRFYDGQHPFIQTGDVANANKFIMEYTQTLNENGYAVSKEFPSGTLVMTIAANIGDMAILNFNACFPDSIVGFLPSKMTDIFFLYHLFSSMKKQFLSTAVLNTQLNLNVERISNIFTVIPPLKEQLQITDFLNKEMQKLDLQKAKIKEAIELLKEYRTSLITNAVTGKIDVSQIAVP
jgi:type I restriction enzyme S subunit